MFVVLEIQIGGGQGIWVQGKKVTYQGIMLLARVQLKAKSKSFHMKCSLEILPGFCLEYNEFIMKSTIFNVILDGISAKLVEETPKSSS